MNKDNVAPKKKKRRRKKKKPMNRGLTVFLTVFLIFFMVGIVTCGWVALDVFTDVGLISLFNSSVADDVAGVDYIDLDAYIANQSKTTIIYGYDGNEEIELARLHGAENREWVDLDEVCKDLQDAVIALEDKRFIYHDGVDWVRTIGVVVEYNFSQGGSTITQQLIKNLTGENNRTFVRKYKEIKNALKLEKHYNKNEILEAYLNTIYLDQGCYGIKTAAEYYFDKQVDELTLMECAILASITNAPRRYNPIINYDNNRKRATECLDKMLEQEYITQEEYDAALAEDVVFVGDTGPRKDKDIEEDEEVAVTETEFNSYYVDFIIDTLIKDFQRQYGDSEAEAWRKVYYGGLKVYAAVDLSIQGVMENVYENREGFPQEEDTPENPAIQSSMVIMDYEGRVLGTVGRFGKKTGNRTLNIGTSSPRQPGSSIKPLSCYAPAIDLDYYYWSTYLPNYGINLNGQIWPTNYGGVEGDPNDLRNFPQAIAPSLNTIPARIVQTLTPETSYRFLRDRFHISTLHEKKDIAYSPLATGGLTYGATVLDMTAAFSTFGNGGLYYEPWCYYKVTNQAGTEILLEPDRVGEQVISSGTADVMNHLLQCVVTYPNGTGHRFPVDGFTTFSKSGTSSANKDKWIIGGSPYYICGVWTGFEIPRPIHTGYYPGTGNPAGALYKLVMNRIHDGLEPKEFSYGDECVKRSYCTVTGLLAGRYCPTATGYYKVDNLPSVCTVCGGNGTPADYEIPQF